MMAPKRSRSSRSDTRAVEVAPWQGVAPERVELESILTVLKRRTQRNRARVARVKSDVDDEWKTTVEEDTS